MKTVILAVTAIVISSATMSAEPPSAGKAEEARSFLTQDTPGGQLPEYALGQTAGLKSDLLQQAISSNSDYKEAVASEADSIPATKSSMPAGLELGQNYPNPFNSGTEIKYGLPARSSVRISVYNIFGQKVRTIKEAIEDSGYYSVNWDGRDDKGDLLASGMYFYVFASDDNYITRKMLFLK